jgi:hypothetical protein
MGIRWYQSRNVQASVLGALITGAATLGAARLSDRDPSDPRASLAAVGLPRDPKLDAPYAGPPHDWISHGSPEQFGLYIATLPPLSKQQTFDSVFVGRWVRWSGVVMGIEVRDSSYLVVTRSADADHEAMVAVFFLNNQRGALEPVRAGDTIGYVGRLIPAGIPRFEPHASNFDIDSAQVLVWRQDRR